MPRRVTTLSCAAATAALFGLSACTSWKSQYSGVFRDSDKISIQLIKQGGYMIGFCGICRTEEASYALELKPIKQTYHDDEIRLTQVEIVEPRSASHPTPRFLVLKTRGTVSFDSDYSHFTLTVMIDTNGHLAAFPGNGRYAVESGE